MPLQVSLSCRSEFHRCLQTPGCDEGASTYRAEIAGLKPYPQHVPAFSLHQEVAAGLAVQIQANWKLGNLETASLTVAVISSV